MEFTDLGLNPCILDALKKEGYVTPTPIQQQAIMPALKGRDIVGCAQTGTGKTAAFALPILHRLSEQDAVMGAEHTAPNEDNPYASIANQFSKQPDKSKQSNLPPSKTSAPSKTLMPPKTHLQSKTPVLRALILSPTRELSQQIYESFRAYGKYVGLKYALIMGGVSQHSQTEDLERGADILIATPGRLLDLHSQHLIDLSHIEIFVLDEADRMLDMGFIHDVRKVIVLLPKKRQTMLFTATMPPEVLKLTDTILINPVSVTASRVSSTVDAVAQTLYFTDKASKPDLLIHLIKSDQSIRSALIFARTKYGADKLSNRLKKAGITSLAIHGDKSQNARQNALGSFKNLSIRTLVATDIAARGIDIEDLTHVINYEIPNVPETYVHRIGRTGRAGKGGTAISLCDFDEKEYVADIEKLTKKKIEVVENHPYPMTVFVKSPPKQQTPRPPRNRPR